MVLVVGLTVMTLVVAPFDQVILPEEQFPVKLVEVPLQIVDGLPAVKAMLGAAGIGLTFRLTVALSAGRVSQSPLVFLQPT